MPNQELIDYIKTELSLKKEPDEIKAKLVNAGWLTENVDEALAFVVQGETPGFFQQDLESAESAPLPNPKVHFLLWALVLDLVGFGTCVMAFNNEFLLIIPSLVYIVAAIMAIISIKAIQSIRPGSGTRYNIWVRIIVTLLALAIGGWGAFWGGYGLLIVLSGGFYF